MAELLDFVRHCPTPPPLLRYALQGSALQHQSAPLRSLLTALLNANQMVEGQKSNVAPRNHGTTPQRSSSGSGGMISDSNVQSASFRPHLLLCTLQSALPSLRAKPSSLPFLLRLLLDVSTAPILQTKLPPIGNAIADAYVHYVRSATSLPVSHQTSAWLSEATWVNVAHAAKVVCSHLGRAMASIPMEVLAAMKGIIQAMDNERTACKWMRRAVQHVVVEAMHFVVPANRVEGRQAIRKVTDALFGAMWSSVKPQDDERDDDDKRMQEVLASMTNVQRKKLTKCVYPVALLVPYALDMTDPAICSRTIETLNVLKDSENRKILRCALVAMTSKKDNSGAMCELAKRPRSKSDPQMWTRTELHPQQDDLGPGQLEFVQVLKDMVTISDAIRDVAQTAVKKGELATFSPTYDAVQFLWMEKEAQKFKERRQAAPGASSSSSGSSGGGAASSVSPLKPIKRTNTPTAVPTSSNADITSSSVSRATTQRPRRRNIRSISFSDETSAAAPKVQMVSGVPIGAGVMSGHFEIDPASLGPLLTQSSVNDFQQQRTWLPVCCSECFAPLGRKTTCCSKPANTTSNGTVIPRLIEFVETMSYETGLHSIVCDPRECERPPSSLRIALASDMGVHLNEIVRAKYVILSRAVPMAQSVSLSSHASSSSSSSSQPETFLYCVVPQTPDREALFLFSKTGGFQRYYRVPGGPDPDELKVLKLERLSDSLATKFRTFVSKSMQENFKIGIMYMKNGQNEMQMYENTEFSDEFVDFVHLVGGSVRLDTHDGYKGGLKHTSEGFMTHAPMTTMRVNVASGRVTKVVKGSEKFTNTDNNGSSNNGSVHDLLHQVVEQDSRSLDEYCCTINVVWHAVNYIPVTNDDERLLHRKRHIGNDVVVVVFRDYSCTTPFYPIFASHFNHVFIVVQPAQLDPVSHVATHYYVQCTALHGVSPIEPFLPNGPLYSTIPRSQLGAFITVKCVNAEQSAFAAKSFATRFRGLREKFLQDFEEEIDNAQSSSSSSSSSSSPISKLSESAKGLRLSIGSDVKK